jgi:hypothetical protein
LVARDTTFDKPYPPSSGGLFANPDTLTTHNRG